MNKKLKRWTPDKLILAVLFFFILVSPVFVSAITGSIGNARMILRAETGDEIEKYVLVKNVNDVAIDVQISVSGDLAEHIDIQDESFTLEAGDEKKAYFTVDVKKSGTSESKINVQFTPVDGGNGVGLSSTVIVIAEGDDSGWFNWGDDSDDNTDNNQDDNSGVSVSPGGNSNSENSDNKRTVLIIISLSFTGLIIVIFVVLIIWFYSKNKKKSIKIKRITKSKKSAKR